MSLTASGWSVVLVGAWNPAILSPAGISVHVFGLPLGQPVRVAVPLDGVSAYLVANTEDTLTAYVKENRLQINLRQCRYQNLQLGLAAALRVLDVLPLTPLAAVGINLDFISPDPIPELAELTNSPADIRIAQEGMAIRVSSLQRTLQLPVGVLNVTVTTSATSRVRCNFHLDAANAETARLLFQTSIPDIQDAIAKVGRILTTTLQEVTDDNVGHPPE